MMLGKQKSAKKRRLAAALLSAALVLQLGMPAPLALAEESAADGSLSNIPALIEDAAAPQDAAAPTGDAAQTDPSGSNVSQGPACDLGVASDACCPGAPTSVPVAPESNTNTASPSESGSASNAQQPDAPKPGIEPTDDDLAIDSVQPDAIQPVDETAPAALDVQTSNTGTKTSGDLTVEGLDDKGVLLVAPYYKGGPASGEVTAKIPQADPDGIIRVESSDPSVVAVREYYDELYMYESTEHMAYFDGGAYGTATITMTYVASSGETSVVSFVAVHCPGQVQNVTAAKASNSKVKLSWTAIPGVSGYRIYA
ncbi:MAG: hypothetical protein U0J70_02050, partial [Atopobiaceae bacterium]|nr:hypothetical protein [Atopobiaceae bacterium]